MNLIEEMYIKDRRRDVNMMARILRGDHAAAEDVVQEAYTRAIQYQATYDPERAELRTWFNSLLFNSLRDYQKMVRGQPDDVASDFSAEDLAEEWGMTTPHDRELLASTVESISNEKHRMVMELFFLRGYTAREISQLVEKCSVSNVTTIAMRMKEKVNA